MSYIWSKILKHVKETTLEISLFLRSPSADIAKSLLSLVIISAIIFFVVLFFVGLSKYFITIEPFEVPVSLSERGYTGKTVANRIAYAIDNVTLDSGFKINGMTVTAASLSSPDIEIPGSGNSMRSLVIHFREIINKPLPTISGDIVNNNNNLIMAVRVVGYDGESSTQNKYLKDKDNDVEVLIQKAAEEIYLKISPVVLASYYINNQHYQFAINVFETTQIDPKVAGETYLRWAFCLYMTKKYDKALQLIEQAAKEDNNDVINNHIYRVWGYILRKQCRFDEAITKLNQAIEYFPYDSYSFSVKGNILKLQKKYPEAKESLDKAIELDGRNEEAKYDLKQLLSGAK